MNHILVRQIRTLERKTRELPDDFALGFAIRYAAKTIIVYYTIKESDNLYQAYRLSIYENGNWLLELRYQSTIIDKGEYVKE